ncbi:Alpha/Beta hydrolase protein [Aspergillus cavernicola]|uniref:Dipeptidyl-peptidase V n=1 Tax=Aspergillus cavernicola TaxID=176166 RepID=A0ABR4I5Y0_9EURO
MTQLTTTEQPPQLTPTSLIESPVRSHPVPNSSGMLAVFTQQYHTQQTSTLQSAIRVIDLNSARSWPIPDSANARFPQWLGHSDQLIWLERLENGHAQFVVGDARLQSPAYIAGSVTGGVWDLRAAGVVLKEDAGDDDDLSFAVIGEANPDGTLFNPLDAGRAGPVQPPAATSEVTAQYSHGDVQRKNVIWFGCLVRPSGSPSGRYTIPRVTNLMLYFNLGEVSLQASPDENNQNICRDFCMTSWTILFAAKDPELDGSRHTACSCYICSMLDWSGLLVPDDYYKVFRHRGLGGAISSPSANKRGAVTFLSQKQDGSAADKNQIIFITDPQSGTYKEIFASADGKGQWDLSPSGVSFASDGKLLLKVDERGQRVLYQLDPTTWPNEPTPEDLKRVEPLFLPRNSLVEATAVSEKSSRVLVTCDSFIHGRKFILKDLVTGSTRDLSLDIPRFGLSENQIDQVWFPGVNNRQIHAWVIKPSYFNPEKKYPLAYFIHGTQHGSWTSSWNTNTSLNLALFAEHGYVVVAPNITGSSGYGQDFVNGTRHSFAGTPYLDLKHGFEYLEKEISYIDTNRSVALGDGYGGYMVNWIQGQDLGRKFRALVTYNGIFNIMSYLSSNVQHLILHEMGGPPWSDTLDEWTRWDPTRYLHNWNTPHLVIHGVLNEEHPVSDAVAAVRTLQFRGVDCGFLKLADEGREVRKVGNLLLLYRTVLEWMDRYTGR